MQLYKPFCYLPLESSPGVTEVTIIEKAPAERHMISSWEQVSVVTESSSPYEGHQCPQGGKIRAENPFLCQITASFHSMPFPFYLIK